MSMYIFHRDLLGMGRPAEGSLDFCRGTLGNKHENSF